MKRLKEGKLVGVMRGTYVLTVKGNAEATRARYNAAAAGATYG